MDRVSLENHALVKVFKEMTSSDIGSWIIGAVVLIVTCLVYWIYFYRRERTATANCRKVLQKVFAANNGDMWIAKYRNQWQTSAPLSKWAGIEVQDQGAGDVVTELNMRDNKNFIGTRVIISLEIGIFVLIFFFTIFFSGSFPPVFTMKSLVSLDFDHCEMSGVIPNEIGLLTNLTYLNLAFNQFTGGIPEEIGNLTELTFLNLNRNPLGGDIPASIGKLKKLEHLWLANCKLTGDIPFDIGHLVELRDLILCENKLSGTIPSEIGVMSKLDRLVLSMNDLKGKIPASLGQCKNLTLLYLDRNHITGQLPVELLSLSQLTEMWLYCTNVTVDGLPISECGSFLKSRFQHAEIVVIQPKTPTRVLVRKEIPTSPK